MNKAKEKDKKKINILKIINKYTTIIFINLPCFYINADIMSLLLVFKFAFFFTFFYLFKMANDDYHYRRIKKSHVYAYSISLAISLLFFISKFGIIMNPYHLFLYILISIFYFYLLIKKAFQNADMYLFFLTGLFFLFTNSLQFYIAGVSLSIIALTILNRNKVDDSIPFVVSILAGFILGLIGYFSSYL